LGCRLAPSLDRKEQKRVLDLLSRSFGLRYAPARRLFSFFLRRVPRKHCFIVEDARQRILGVLFVLDRALDYFGVSLRVAGLSYMAIHAQHRNFSISSILKQRLFRWMDGQSDISMGFARKIMDGYWYPYGYVGITNFGKMSLPLSFLPAPKQGYSMRRAQPQDYPFIRKSYKHSYRTLVGPLNRDAVLWSYYFARIQREKLNLQMIGRGNRSIGYCITKDNVVHELGGNSNAFADIAGVIGTDLSRHGHTEVILEIGFLHPFALFLSDRAHTKVSRFAWNGGHILRITRLPDLLRKIRPVLERRLRAAQVKNFRLACNNILFIFSRGRLRVEPFDGKPDIALAEHEWPKIIFGAADPGHLSALRGHPSAPLLRLMFPVGSPQVPYLDQF
jgi:hypothetical protein